MEAQTLANTYLALDHDLEIRPVINKIDLPAANPQRVKEEVENVIGLDAAEAPEDLRQDGHQHPGGAGGHRPPRPPPQGTPRPPSRP